MAPLGDRLRLRGFSRKATILSPFLALRRFAFSPAMSFNNCLYGEYPQIKYLDENLGALKVKLTKDNIAVIRDLIEKSDATKGERYLDAFKSLAYTDTPELGPEN